MVVIHVAKPRATETSHALDGIVRHRERAAKARDPADSCGYVVRQLEGGGGSDPDVSPQHDRGLGQ